MTEYTENYGAITSITDPRTTLDMTDSTGTEFTFEVYPLNIQEKQIKSYQKSFDLKRWLIYFKADLHKPSDAEIAKALENGYIIKIFFKVAAYDNYGIRHTISFDTEIGQYVFDKNPFSKENLKNISPFADEIIKYIKEADNSEWLIQSLNNSIRLYHGYIHDKFTELNNTIKELQEKIKLLES